MDPITLDPVRNKCMLVGRFAQRGYDWWWHSFTAHDEETGAEQAFFIEYFLTNPALGGSAPIFGMRPDGTRGQAPSYMMVKAGRWGKEPAQLHRFFGWDDVELGAGAPYWVAADDCLACDTDLIGSVCVTPEDAAAHPEWMSDAGSMAWDLHLNKQLAYNVGWGASTPSRAAGAFEMYWHAEGMKTLVSGVVVFNGRRYIVDPETSYGYSDKNWGGDFTSPWVWLASSNLRSRVDGHALTNSAFDIGGGRPVVLGFALERKLLGCIVYEGESFEFNFSKPWTMSTTQFDCSEQESEIVWHVRQETSTACMVVDVICQKDEMVLANYESPDGMKRHQRLWNGGTGTGRVQLFRKQGSSLVLVDDMDAFNIGCEFGEYDRQ